MKRRLLNLHFNDFTEKEFVEKISCDIDKKNKVTVFTPNIDIMRMTYKNEDVCRIFNNSTYSTIDGKILFVVSKLYRSKIKNKLSGSDMAKPILELANQKKLNVYLFGGKPGVADLAASKIKTEHPDIKICGTFCPNFGFEKNDEEIEEILESINSANPDIVFMCCGAPKTEFFISSHLDRLPNAVYLSIGATIDFIAGTIKRAPRWMQVCGLEWFYRLLKEPKRLFKRYFLDSIFLFKIIFFGIFLRGKFKEKYYTSLKKR